MYYISVYNLSSIVTHNNLICLNRTSLPLVNVFAEKKKKDVWIARRKIWRAIKKAHFTRMMVRGKVLYLCI